MINWQLKLHLNGEKYHSRLYRAKYKGFGIQMEVHTPVLKNHGGPKDFGKAETYYFIDGIEKEFSTEEKLIKAIEKMEEVE